MMYSSKHAILMLTTFFALFLFSANSAKAQYPHTDQANTGHWVLNKEVSDEFTGTSLDENKWLIQGRNGEYRSNWIGRAPSQFSTENVRIENGKLKLQNRWDPNFNFSSTPDKSGVKYENYTTSAVISRKQFKYGYMEIRCKAANTSVQSSFWATGSDAELDVFEFNGNPSDTGKDYLETQYWCSIHDWGQSGGPSVWTDKQQLPFRVAGGYHTYACEWDKDYVKFYADGVLVTETTKAELGSKWVLDGPMWVWVDNETFPWQGLPAKEDLPMDYEIEYIRVWQRGAPMDKVIWLKSSNGKYVTVGAKNNLEATATTLTEKEKFEVVDAGDGYFALKSVTNGKYMQVIVNSDNQLRAGSSVIANQQKFTWEELFGTTISIKAKINGRYIWTTKNVSNQPLKAKGISVQGWEQFTWGTTTKKSGQLVDDFTVEQLVQVYPNPLSGGQNLTIQFKDASNKQITIYDMNGRTLYTRNLQQKTIEISSLNLGMSKGMYLIKVASQTGNYSQKLLVQ